MSSKNTSMLIQPELYYYGIIDNYLIICLMYKQQYERYLVNVINLDTDIVELSFITKTSKEAERFVSNFTGVDY